MIYHIIRDKFDRREIEFFINKLHERPLTFSDHALEKLKEREIKITDFQQTMRKPRIMAVVYEINDNTGALTDIRLIVRKNRTHYQCVEAIISIMSHIVVTVYNERSMSHINRSELNEGDLAIPIQFLIEKEAVKQCKIDAMKNKKLEKAKAKFMA